MKRAVCTRYECRKLLFAQRGIWLIAAAVCVQILICLTARFHAYNYTFDTNAYRIYAERFAGPYRAETAAEIAEELAEQINNANTPLPDSLTADEYAEFSANISLAQSKIAVLQEISAHYSTLEHTGGDMCYDLELCDLIARFSVNWSSLLCIAVLTVLILLGDRGCGMEQILFPTKAGKRRIQAAKLLTAAVLSAVVTALCLALQWGIFGVRWQLGKWDIPVQSLTGFFGCALQITVGQAILLASFMQIMAAVSAAMLTALCAKLLKKEIPAITAAVMLIGIGAAISGQIPQTAPFLLWRSLSGMSALSGASARDVIVSLLFMVLRLTFILGAVTNESMLRW